MIILRATVVAMGIHICMTLRVKKVEKATHICMMPAVDAEVKVDYRSDSL